MQLQKLEGRARLAWPMALSVGALLGSLAAACMFPFAGFAAVAALTMDRGRGLAAVAGVWAINQAVGYSALGYPSDGNTLAWGIAIGLATVAAFFVARAAARIRSTAAMLTIASLGAFATYEGLLYAFAHVAGGLETFSPAIVGLVFRNDLIWFVGLIGLRLLLTRSAPKMFGSEQALRPA